MVHETRSQPRTIPLSCGCSIYYAVVNHMFSQHTSAKYIYYRVVARGYNSINSASGIVVAMYSFENNMRGQLSFYMRIAL